MAKVEFTGKIGAKHLCFLSEDRTEHCAYYVFLEATDGRKLTVNDESSPVGMLGAETRAKAITKGKAVLKRLTEEEAK